MFAYFYLWTIAPAWPPDRAALPAPGWPLGSAALWVLAAAGVVGANRALAANARGVFRAALCGAFVLAGCALALAAWGQIATGFPATEHAFGAIVYVLLAYQALFVAVLGIMTAYLLARSWAGLLDRTRRATFDNCRLFWLYAAAQGVVALAVAYGAPSLAG